jgi:hypothetical protein
LKPRPSIERREMARLSQVVQVRGTVFELDRQRVPRGFRREEVAGPAAADHVLLRDDRHDGVRPPAQLDDIGEIVYDIRGDPSSSESPNRLEAVVSIEDHEIAVGDKDWSTQVSVPPDLAGQFLEERGSDALVAMELPDLQDLKPDAPRAPSHTAPLGHQGS